MLNAFFAIGYFSAAIYGMFIDGTYWKIYGVTFVLYLIFVTCTRVMRDNTKRKTLLISTWNGKIKVTLLLCRGL